MPRIVFLAAPTVLSLALLRLAALFVRRTMPRLARCECVPIRMHWSVRAELLLYMVVSVAHCFVLLFLLFVLLVRSGSVRNRRAQFIRKFRSDRTNNRQAVWGHRVAAASHWPTEDLFPFFPEYFHFPFSEQKWRKKFKISRFLQTNGKPEKL